jgi:hypothetical protein
MALKQILGNSATDDLLIAPERVCETFSHLRSKLEPDMQELAEVRIIFRARLHMS